VKTAEEAMKKRSLFLITVLCVLTSLPYLFADSKTYTVEGEIVFSGTGNIFVSLVTEEFFGQKYEGVRKQILIITQKESEMGQAPFSFCGVEEGTYGIRCYQDENGNGELDGGLFGPTEPWGMSFRHDRPSRWPKFENISFEVIEDVRDLTIALK
jgi:uncharacterized protein (DUF2141 family)